MKTLTRFLAIVTGIAIIIYVGLKIYIADDRAMTRRYREDYREQGRGFVRAEAIRAGVAEIVDGDFSWKQAAQTNPVGVDVTEEELEMLKILLEKLIQRKELRYEEDKEEGASKEVQG